MTTNLTPVQKKALRTIAVGGDQATIKDSTVQALISRGLVQVDLDSLVATDAAQAYFERVGEIDSIRAEIEGTEAPAPAPARRKGKSKTQRAQEQFEKDQAARKAAAERDESADLAANAAAAGQTDAKVKGEAPHGTTKVTRTDKPKADKDDTIRVSAQILAWLEAHGQMRVALEEKLAKATVAKDSSKRIAVSDSDLDELSANAEAMAKAGVSRGEVRSAKALVQWIDGMKARRASRKA